MNNAARSLRRDSARQVEQLAALGLALVFGLAGLAVHFLWVGSIVVMAVLLGLNASGLRGRGDRGVISEVVSEVKIMAQEVTRTDEPEPVAPEALTEGDEPSAPEAEQPEVGDSEEVAR